MSKQKRDDTYDRPGRHPQRRSGDGERQRGPRPEPPRSPKRSGDFLRQWEDEEETATLEDEDLFERDEDGQDDEDDDEPSS